MSYTHRFSYQPNYESMYKSTLVSNNQPCDKRVAKLEDDFNYVLEQLSATKSKLSMDEDLRKTSDMMIKQNMSLLNQNNLLVKEISKIRIEYQSLNKAVQAKEKIIEGNKNTQQQHIKEIEELNKTILKLKSQKMETTISRKVSSQYLIEIQALKQQLEKQKNKFQEQRRELNLTIQQFYFDNRDLTLELQRYKIQLEVLDKKYNQEINDAQEEYQEIIREKQNQLNKDEERIKQYAVGYELIKQRYDKKVFIIEKLEKQIDLLKIENQKLSKQKEGIHNEMKEENQKYNQHIQFLQQKNYQRARQHQTQSLNLKESLNKLYIEQINKNNEDLEKQKLSFLEHMNRVELQNQQLTARNAQLISLNQKLANQKKGLIEEIQRFSFQTDHSEQQNTVQQQLEKEQMRSAALQSLVKQYQYVNDELNETIILIETRARELEKKNIEISQQSRQGQLLLSENIRLLKEQLSILEKNHSSVLQERQINENQWKQQKKELTKNVERLQHLNAQLKNSIEIMQTQMRQNENEIHKLKYNSQEELLYNKKLQGQFRKEIADLKSRISEYEANFNTQFNSISHENLLLEEQNKQIIKNYDNNINQLKTQIKELVDIIEEKDVQIKGLQKQMNELSEEYESLIKESQVGFLAEKQIMIKKYQTQKQDLINALTKIKQESQLNVMEIVKKKDTQKYLYHKQNESKINLLGVEKKQLIKNIENMHNNYRRLNEDYNALMETLKHERQTHLETKQELNCARRNKIIDLERQRDEFQNYYNQELEEINETHQKQIRELTKQISELNEINTEAHTRYNELQEKYKILTARQTQINKDKLIQYKKKMGILNKGISQTQNLYDLLVNTKAKLGCSRRVLSEIPRQ